MSKRQRSQDSREGRMVERAGGGSAFMSGSTLGIVTLIGVVVLIFMNARLWSQSRQVRQQVDQVERTMAQLREKVDAVASRPAQPQPAQRQGPDPNRVYSVKTDGAPTKGPATAVVTIAEFSDFQ